MTRIIPITVKQTTSVYRPIWYFRVIPDKHISVWEWQKVYEATA